MIDPTSEPSAGGSTVLLRAGDEHDLAPVLELNHEAVPAVNDIDLDELTELVAGSVRFTVAVERDTVVGFIIVLPTGLAYESLNYRWFSDRFDDFWYVDRVVVSPEAKGRGVGAAIYESVFADAVGQAPRICAEVNLKPRNEPSLRFHDRFGFASVGTQPTEGGTKEVTLLAASVPESVAEAESEPAVDAEPENETLPDPLVDAESEEIGRLEADVASVSRLLDGLGDLSTGERSMILDGLEDSSRPAPDDELRSQA